jgi:serine/threonine-protein kinase
MVSNEGMADSSAVAVSASAPDDFWRRASDWLDRLLDATEPERAATLERLERDEPDLAREVHRLLARMHGVATLRPGRGASAQGLTTELATLIGSERQGAFEQLLSHALGPDATRPPEQSRQAGDRLGPWRLTSLLGVGGMGEVWAAERADGLYAAQVAIKVLHASHDPERFEARFSQERALLARLDHPHIARLIDAGRAGNVPYLVIEHVDGRPLLDAVSETRCDLDARIALIEQVADALAYAHRQLVVHRDIKPSNVLVTQEGRVKLLDFGVAGWLDDGSDAAAPDAPPATRIAGRGLTLEYAAPELITGEASGVAADVYSLAALAYHVLTGRRPHLIHLRSRVALEHAILHTDPPRASEAARQIDLPKAPDTIAPPADHARLRGDLDAILATALRREPAERYASVEAFMADLRRWRERRPIATRRDDRRYRVGLWFRRNWLPASFAALSLSLLVGGFVMTWIQYRVAQSEAARATKTTQYLAELLRSADPDLNGGSAPDVIDLLDRAARDTANRFGNEPATEYELTQLLASTYRSLSRDADALPLARRAAALATMHFGPRSIQALQSARTLAEVQYWTGDFSGARQTLAEVYAPLLAQLPRASPYGGTDGSKGGSTDAFDLERLRSEIECAAFAVEGARDRFAELRQHPALATMPPDGRRWALADLAGREALCLSRGGDWPRALALLVRHAPDYAAPPEAHRKTALYHREFLLTAQMLLGDAASAERTARELITEWQSLAGERSDRIDTLLTILAQHYLLRGDATRTLATTDELQRRGVLKPASEFGAAAAPLLGRLEAEALFNSTGEEAILERLDALVQQLMAQGNRDLPRFRQHLFRAAIIALTYGRLDLAERYAELGRRHGRDRAPSSAIRELQLASMLARARSQHGDAVTLYDRRLASFDERGERVSLRRAMLSLSRAYQLWLAGERRPQQLEAALRAAEASAPQALPEDGLYRLQYEWLRALFTEGEDTRSELAARAQLAERYGRPVEQLPRVLNGLYLL